MDPENWSMQTDLSNKDWFDQRGRGEEFNELIDPVRGHAFLSKTRWGSARASRSVPASAAFPQAHYSRGFINLSLRAGGRRGSRTGLTPRVEKRATGSRSNLEAEGGPAYPRRSAAPSVVENRRLVSRLAKRLFYLDPAICQTPYELYTPSRRIVQAPLFLPFVPLSKGYLAARAILSLVLVRETSRSDRGEIDRSVDRVQEIRESFILSSDSKVSRKSIMGHYSVAKA